MEDPKRRNHELSAMRCPLHLDDVDLFGEGGQEHWYEAYDILHRDAPVYRIPGEGLAPGSDAFILTKYEDIAAVVRDEERFPPAMSLTVKQLAKQDRSERPMLNVMFESITTLRPTPELWRAHRQELTDPWVGPGAGRHEAMIQGVADDLVAKFIDRGSLDFVKEFAQPLPHTVMANVIGWPLEDLPLLKRFGDATVKPFVYGSGHRCILPAQETEAQFEELGEFEAYTQALITARRSDPRDDMITFLTQVEYSPLKRKLSDAEVNGIVYAMVIGGLETTQYALAEQVQLLIENPQIWRELKQDPGKVRAFTEEGMRMRSPTQGLSTRTTSQDEVFQGVKVPKGSLLHMRWAAANMDPDEWGDPKALRLDRKAVTRHLTFSHGARVCPGAGISRLEQQIAWTTLLDRVKEFRYARDNDFLHQPGIMLGTLALHLEFEPETG